MTDMQRGYVCQSASSTMMLFANYLTLCVYDYMYTQLIHNVIRIYFTFYLLLLPTYFLFFLMFIQHLRHAVWVITVVSGGFGRAGPWHADGFRVVQGWCSLVVQ